MSNYLSIDAQTVKAEIARLMEQFPDLADDSALAMDTFEGETDLFNVVGMAVKERAEKLAMAEGVKGYIGELSERKARFERTADALKALVQSLMDVTGQDKITLPEATVFTTKPRTGVEITSLDDIPQGYAKFEKKADKAAIKAALEAGEFIPGAELTFGEPGLTIRTK